MLVDALDATIRDSPPAVPNPPNGDADDAGAPPVEAPPNRLPAGFGASPSFFWKPKPLPKAGVVAPVVAGPPPNKPPGLEAGVLDAPPKRPPDPPVLPPAPPKRPPLAGVLEVLLVVENRDGVALPVEGAAPNSGLLGVLLPPLLLLA